MSTKIYNGYKLPLMSIQEVQTLMLELREKVLAEMKQACSKILFEHATRLIDAHALGLTLSPTLDLDEVKNNKGVPFVMAIGRATLRQKKVRETQIRDPSYDFDCDISIIPCEDKLLAIFFTEHNEYVKIWESFEQVEKIWLLEQYRPTR